MRRSAVARWLTPSSAALLLANLTPIAGVVLLGWEVFPILLLFWLENVIVGVFNVLRMLWVAPTDIGRWLAKLFMVPFFVVHYGMFTAIHGVFVVAIFGGEAQLADGLGIGTIWDIVRSQHLLYGAAALAVSHGFSFVWNYIRNGEYRRTALNKLMQQPYTRVVVLHVVIVASGFLVMALQAPTAGLVLLVALKIGVDVHAHVREHEKLREDGD